MYRTYHRVVLEFFSVQQNQCHNNMIKYLTRSRFEPRFVLEYNRHMSIEETRFCCVDIVAQFALTGVSL